MRTASIDLVLDSNQGKSMSLLPFMPLHLGSDIGNKMNCWACREIWYGEKWDEFRHSWHSATPDLRLSRYRRISWHWFQGLRHDSYLDTNISINGSIHGTLLWQSWYLGNYHAWDLETSVSLCADVDLTPNPGSPNVTNVETHLISHHITHVRGSAVQLIPDVWAQV